MADQFSFAKNVHLPRERMLLKNNFAHIEFKNKETISIRNLLIVGC